MIVLIAKLASKTRPKEERLLASEESMRHKNGGHSPEKQIHDKLALDEGLISLLIKKGVITEEELLFEVERVKKLKGGH
jgi:hypothetical protein